MSEVSNIPVEGLALKEESVAYWQSHIDRYKSSGINHAEYCRKNTLKYCVFLYSDLLTRLNPSFYKSLI